MKFLKQALILTLSAAMICPMASITAEAKEKRINEYLGANDASHATITATVPGNVESDTLSAIADGVRWPEKPHAGGGANPYAWTNYHSAQLFGIEETSSLTFEFPWETEVAQIALYYFVDTWSASLPASVEFVTNENGQEFVHTARAFEVQQITDTCVRQNYHIDTPPTCKTFEIRFASDGTSKKKGNTRCVGLYEVEIYNSLGSPIIHEPEYHESSWSGFTGIYGGSVEVAHKKYAHNAADGNPDTIWHTDWNGASLEERYLEIYFYKSENLAGIRYLPRQGNKSGDNNGRIKKYEVYSSSFDYDSNGEPIWTLVATGEFPDNDKWQEIRFEPVSNVSDVKIVGVETYGVKQNKWMSAAEIEVISWWYE